MKGANQKDRLKLIRRMNATVYLRFILKVDQGRTFTLCPIMDILWRVGCLLNTTRSPSLNTNIHLSRNKLS